MDQPTSCASTETDNEEQNDLLDHVLPLPLELMFRIFKFLTANQQARARQVCKQWNIWLHSPEFVKEVRLEIPEDTTYCVSSHGTYCNGFRKLAISLQNTVTADTQKLILIGSPAAVQNTGPGLNKLLDTLGPTLLLAQRTMASQARETTTVILCDLSVQFDIFPSELAEQPVDLELNGHEDCARIPYPASWVVLNNVTVRNIVPIKTSASFKAAAASSLHNFLDIKIEWARIHMCPADYELDLWNALEKWCPAVELAGTIIPAGFRAVAEPVQYETFDEKTVDLHYDTVIILHSFEDADPRTPEAFRNQCRLRYKDLLDLPENALRAVKVRGLKKLTLALMDRLFRYVFRPETGQFTYHVTDSDAERPRKKRLRASEAPW